MYKKNYQSSQSGIVLFFALLALAVMSIASVALIRSVDTNSAVSGNLVFRQHSNSSASVALEHITREMANIDISQANQVVSDSAYYPTCTSFDEANAPACSSGNLTKTTWNDNNSRLVPMHAGEFEAIDADGRDRFGNTLRYLVERMCTSTTASVENCMMAGAGGDPGCSYNTVDIEYTNPCKAKSDNPLYRVTVRIAGPKNNVSFVQAFYSN